MTVENVVPVLSQSASFTAQFTIKVNGLRTSTVNGVQNIVKQVEWTLIGEELGQKFELPQTTPLADPSAEVIVPLASLTKEDVIAWIEQTDDCLPGMKAHIQYVLKKEIAKASLEVATIPWSDEAVSVSTEIS